MPQTIRATDASRGFSRLPDRVRSGEAFDVVRNGEVVGRLVPPPPRAVTLAELRELLAGQHLPDAFFADDVESGRRTVGAEEDPWGS